MSIWIAKALIQKTISFLPFKHKINYVFQRYVTKGVLLTDNLMDDKLIHCHNHLKYYYKYGVVKENFTSLEIGTGWYPIVPLGLYLAGAGNIYTIDISDLLKTSAVKETILKFKIYDASGKLKTYLNNYDKNRLDILIKLFDSDLPAQQLLESLGIKSIIGDARKIDLPDETFDLINSNNTFEHIYPGILADILKEFKRLLKPDGVMSHQIDMSDHFAHLDKSITIYNYLQYSDNAWSWIDNSIQPQNRLRISDYRGIYKKLDMEIIEEMNRPGSIDALHTIKISDKFKKNAESDIAVSHSLLVSKA